MKRILPGGQFETYAYDDGGNLESKTDFNSKMTTFTYDVMRRLLSKIPDASLNQPTISFTYKPIGQRATMSDASGATVYNYDVRNRLSSKQTPFGTLSYTYNEAGSLFTMRSSNADGTSLGMVTCGYLIWEKRHPHVKNRYPPGHPLITLRGNFN